MDTYDRIELLMSKHGEIPSDLAKATGISTGLLSQWKSRMQHPSAKKAALVAKHYGVSTDYLLTGEQKEKAPVDVIDEDLREYLDELRSRPEQRMLFSVTKNATKAQIEAIVKMVEEMQGNK